MRRTTGLPHKILLDEAHYFLGGADVSQLIDPELAGYIFVTYRVSSLPEPVRATADAVVMVTREADPEEAKVLLAMCRPQPCAGVSPAVFRDLGTTEAALLPGAEEAHGQVRRFQMSPRLTSHVRHRAKYLDMPVLDSQAFVFTGNGRPAARAHSLKEFAGLLAILPAEHLAGHLRRHDFSRWIDDVFRDRPLAAHLRTVEARVETDDSREVLEALAQAIRARYETLVGGLWSWADLHGAELHHEPIDIDPSHRRILLILPIERRGCRHFQTTVERSSRSACTQSSTSYPCSQSRAR